MEFKTRLLTTVFKLVSNEDSSRIKTTKIKVESVWKVTAYIVDKLIN